MEGEKSAGVEGRRHLYSVDWEVSAVSGMFREFQFFLGYKKYAINHRHNQLLSATFVQILNCITINGF